MSGMRIVIADIVDMDTDCVVNAANEGLREGGGVCGAIFRKAGADELTQACRKIGGCPTGSAIITPGFGLKAKYIIHAVGPVWSGTEEDRELLTSCYKESLYRAMENSCHSIAFPLISAGIFGCPLKAAWNQAIKGCVEWTEEHPDYDIDIIFTVRKQEVKELGDEVLEAYLDPERRPDQGNYILFWKLGERNEEFTNFYPCSFTVDGVQYNCVEQYMMAMKAKLFKDEEQYANIMNAKDGSEIKSYGRLVKNFDPKVWDEKKRQIGLEGNLAKYTQNGDLLNKLLATGNAYLVEANPDDKVWGIGMDRYDKYARSPGYWKGDNLLGQILMDVKGLSRISISK